MQTVDFPHLQEGICCHIMAKHVMRREDAKSLSPCDESDPEFGVALGEAVRCGVEAYAYSCCVSREEIALERRIPVLL